MRGIRIGRIPVVVLDVVLLVAMGLVAITGVIQPFLGTAGPVSDVMPLPVRNLLGGPFWGGFPSVDVNIDWSKVRVSTDPHLPVAVGTFESGEAVEFYGLQGAGVAVYNPDFQQRLGLIGAPVLAGILAIVVLVLLRRIVRTLRQGDPFVPVNARRLWLIALLVGVGGQAAALLVEWGRWGILRHPSVEPYVEIDFDPTYLPLPAGLVLLVLAEVFRQGAKLREDVAGLV